jgi:hypothetical protein
MVFPVNDIVRFGIEGEPTEAALQERLAVGREQLRATAREGLLPEL